MHISYIILAHKCPEQLRKMIDSLSGANCRFFIHLDKKIPIEPFLFLADQNPAVKFLAEKNRVDIRWGDFSIVQATLNAMELVSASIEAGYVVLLSGQDYPIKSHAQIDEYFNANNGKNFINCFPLPSTLWPDGLNRVQSYKFSFSPVKYGYKMVPSIWESGFYSSKTIKNSLRLIKAGNFKFLHKIIRKRFHPRDIKLYGGEQWWSLPIQTVKKIIEFCINRQDFLEFHKDSEIPDEMFFNSIIMHLAAMDPSLEIAPSLHYVNWSGPEDQIPVTLVSENFNELLDLPRNYLFARKFDLEKDPGIFKLIDSQLLFNA